MHLLELKHRIDSWATADPDARGYGYHDSQYPWAYDPAIEQERDSWLKFMAFLLREKVHGDFLQIGLGRRGGAHASLREVAQRVVTVEIDPERVASYTGDRSDARDVFVVGDSHAPETLATVRGAAPRFDLLLIDGGDSLGDVARDWRDYAPLVAPGGIVAIADASQGSARARTGLDVDQFVFELQRSVLQPQGVRIERFGSQRAIHVYRQPQIPLDGTALDDFEARAVASDSGLVPCEVAAAQEHAGFALFAQRDVHYAVPAAEAAAEFDLRDIDRRAHSIVLTAGSRTELERIAATYAQVSPELAAVRQALRDCDYAAADRRAQAVLAAHPTLRADWIPSLALHRYSAQLLKDLGTVCVYSDHTAEGVAMLEQALEQDLSDKEALLTLAQVYVAVLGDEAAARGLIGRVRERMRRLEIAQTCQQRLSGNALWMYPKLLHDVRGVLQVGAHRGEEVEAFNLLGIEQQAYIEPCADAATDLRARCAQFASGATPKVIECALDAEPRARTLLRAQDTACTSWFPHVEKSTSIPVQTTTLDRVFAEGHLDGADYNLLFLDVDGAELDVLEGARQSLHRLDVICVAVFYEPIYDGAPRPEEIQKFLREVDDFGFNLRAHEPGPDARRGDAVFTRATRKRRD